MCWSHTQQPTANRVMGSVRSETAGSSRNSVFKVRDPDGAKVAVCAKANIPQMDQSETFVVGVGSYLGSQALAFGATSGKGTKLVVKSSIASGISTGSRTATCLCGRNSNCVLTSFLRLHYTTLRPLLAASEQPICVISKASQTCRFSGS